MVNNLKLVVLTIYTLTYTKQLIQLKKKLQKLNQKWFKTHFFTIVSVYEKLNTLVQVSVSTMSL